MRPVVGCSWISSRFANLQTIAPRFNGNALPAVDHRLFLIVSSYMHRSFRRSRISTTLSCPGHGFLSTAPIGSSKQCSFRHGRLPGQGRCRWPRLMRFAFKRPPLMSISVTRRQFPLSVIVLSFGKRMFYFHDVVPETYISLKHHIDGLVRQHLPANRRRGFNCGLTKCICAV